MLEVSSRVRAARVVMSVASSAGRAWSGQVGWAGVSSCLNVVRLPQSWGLLGAWVASQQVAAGPPASRSSGVASCPGSGMLSPFASCLITSSILLSFRLSEFQGCLFNGPCLGFGFTLIDPGSPKRARDFSVGVPLRYLNPGFFWLLFFFSSPFLFFQFDS